ncbi:MAG TPA: ATP-binding domain-containing protein [Aggregatilineales bacterium]|nr:ATP-binding domain-containing protein [Aggregatilineales bacterium]
MSNQAAQETTYRPEQALTRQRVQFGRVMAAVGAALTVAGLITLYINYDSLQPQNIALTAGAVMVAVVVWWLLARERVQVAAALLAALFVAIVLAQSATSLRLIAGSLALLTAQASAADGAARTWTWSEVALWGEWLAAEGVLKRGQKKLLTGEVDNEKTITIEDLDRIFTLNALEALLDAFGGSKEDLLEWWLERLPDQFRKRAAFPAAAVRRHGLDALVEQPPVVVGTIHSVKGGEAEVVFLFPDLSPQGAMAYRAPGVHRDSVVRQFYVGMTRAREVLYICPPAVPDLRISV